MMNKVLLTALLWFGTVLGSVSNGQVAAETPLPDRATIERLIAEFDDQWEQWRTDNDQLVDVRQQFDAALTAARTCREDTESRLSTMEQAITAATAETGLEGLDGLRAERASLQERLIDCRLQQGRIGDIVRRIDEQLAQARTSVLLARSEGLRLLPAPDGSSPPAAPNGFVILLLFLAVLPSIRHRIPQLAQLRPDSVVAGLAPPILGLVLLIPLLIMGWWAGANGHIAWRAEIGELMILWIGVAALSLATDHLPRIARQRWWANPGLWVLVTGVCATGLLNRLGEWPLPLASEVDWYRSASFYLLGAVIGLTGFLSLLSLSRELGRILNWWRRIALLLLTIAIIGWVAGRFNLASYLLTAALGSTWCLFIAHLLYVLAHRLLDDLDEGTAKSHRQFRRLIGIRPGEGLSGGAWLRTGIDLTLFLVLVSLLARVWRLDILGVPDIPRLLQHGFDVGDVSVVPANILLGIIAFVLLSMVIGKAKQLATERLVRKGRFGIRSAEAVVTIFGYASIVIAAVVALSVAGFGLGNLALIAGALSVGIGFGLQNIVNNFVSGLILLFERPVKTGDWIRVGQAEGFVTRIRVRSTEIQAFDRSELIVPNSEMIASQVTNLTLHDGVGRLIINVGVAYGSDVEAVRDTLRTVAMEHSEVIHEGSLAPRVLFTRFGDSSLDFELRCYIRNVLARLDINSELNFAIDAAFRRQGIEIPFPQRTLTMGGPITVADNPNSERGTSESD